MSDLNRVLDEAMTLPLEQQEMLVQILQRRMTEKSRDTIAQDAKESLQEFRAGKYQAQSAPEAIASLRDFLES